MMWIIEKLIALIKAIPYACLIISTAVLSVLVTFFIVMACYRILWLLWREIFSHPF